MIELTSTDNINYKNSTPFYDNEGFPITALTAKRISFNFKNINEMKLFFDDFKNRISFLSKEVKLAYKYCYGFKPYIPGMFLDLIDQKK